LYPLSSNFAEGSASITGTADLAGDWLCAIAPPGAIAANIARPAANQTADE
jgi:hypothetical protein